VSFAELIGKAVLLIVAIGLFYMAITVAPSITNPDQWTLATIVPFAVLVVLAVGVRRLVFN